MPVIFSCNNLFAKLSKSPLLVISTTLLYIEKSDITYKVIKESQLLLFLITLVLITFLQCRQISSSVVCGGGSFSLIE